MFDIILAGLAAAVPIAHDLRRAWQRRTGRGSSPEAAAVTAPLGLEPPSPLPQEWQRWAGARPELRGAPRNSILAVRGLAATSPGFRAALLELADKTQIPVDSLAVIMSSESGFKPDALNPLPAAGLIQLTVGANLPGFASADAIRAVTKLSAEEQLSRVVEPYYARMQGARGASPGHLYMLNFLPNKAGQPEDAILGRKSAVPFDGAFVNASAPPPTRAPETFEEAVYRLNSGFDAAKKGTITISDVYAAAEAIARGAQGRRLAVDGRVVDASGGVSNAPAPRGR